MMKFNKIIDLTHSLNDNTPSWSGECGFQSTIKLDYSDCTTDVKFRVQQLEMLAGIGTHMDAPAHCIANGATIDQLLLTNLIAPCVVIDVSSRVYERYTIHCDDIKNFEKEYGRIKPGSFIMIRTGWEKFWNEPEKYRNNYLFPSVSNNAAKFLLTRNIVGIGIDTLSPDRPEDSYQVHFTLLSAGKYIVENAANLKDLPVVGSTVLVLPIKIKDGTEAPIRLIALTSV